MGLVATVTGRWFVARRGLVTGRAHRRGRHRPARLPARARLARRAPRLAQRRHRHVGSPPSPSSRSCSGSCTTTRASSASPPTVRPPAPRSAARRGRPATRSTSPSARLRDAARTKVFWLLAGSFAVCGMSTNGLVGTHFIPAAHDHGMPTTTAAGPARARRRLRHRRHGLLRLAHRPGRPADPARRVLHPARRLALPAAVALQRLACTSTCSPSSSSTASTGWPPCRRRSPCAAAPSASGPRSSSAGSSPRTRSVPPSRPSAPGLVRDQLGTYDLAWYVAGALCLVAAVMCVAIAYRSSVGCVTSAHGLWCEGVRDGRVRA